MELEVKTTSTTGAMPLGYSSAKAFTGKSVREKLVRLSVRVCVYRL